MHMRNDRPTVLQQGADDGLPDPLAATGDDCRSFLIAHDPVIARSKTTKQSNIAVPLDCFDTRLLAMTSAMPERRTPIEAQGQSLAELAAAIDARGGPPPVDRWDPPFCGHSGMTIARDGT